MIEGFRPLSSLSAFTKFHGGWDRLCNTTYLRISVWFITHYFIRRVVHLSRAILSVFWAVLYTASASICISFGID